jgi:CheY-like chemotaxis protein
MPVLDAASAPQRQESAAAAQAIEARRVLVADDNEDAATALGMHLTLLGHEVRIAHDGAQALSISEAFEPQVVLLDLGMPHMSGYDAAREMRRRPWGAQATLVALTGWGQPEDRRNTAAAGFDVHLVKPVDEATLVQVLAGVRPVAAGRGPALGHGVGGPAL